MGDERLVSDRLRLAANAPTSRQLSPTFSIKTDTNTRYLKKVDAFQNNHIHTFITGGNVKFILLMNPDPLTTAYSNFASPPPSRSSTARQSTLLASNPASSQTEDAVRGFVTEVSHAWFQTDQSEAARLYLSPGRTMLIICSRRSTKHGSNAQ